MFVTLLLIFPSEIEPIHLAGKIVVIVIIVIIGWTSTTVRIATTFLLRTLSSTTDLVDTSHSNIVGVVSSMLSKAPNVDERTDDDQTG